MFLLAKKETYYLIYGPLDGVGTGRTRREEATSLEILEEMEQKLKTPRRVLVAFIKKYKDYKKTEQPYPIHPYLIGVPHRIGAFDAALKYICQHKKVWKATGSEIARHYRAQMKDGGPAKRKSAKKR